MKIYTNLTIQHFYR